MDGKEPFPQLPQEVRLTASYLSSDSAFLLDNGINFFLRLGLRLPPEFLMDVFGVDSLVQVDSRRVSLFR